MAITAYDEEILADLRGYGPGASTPVVLDDLSLTLDLGNVLPGEERVRSEGMWVGRLRRIGGNRLRQWGLPLALVDNAELVISELVTNALKHGTGDEIIFRFILAEDLLLILVDDGSPGQPLVREPSSDNEEGRGMLLVRAISLAWGVSQDESRTWCALATRAEWTVG